MVGSILLAIFSALLLILSFPRFDAAFLVWIALVPLLIAVKNKSLKFAFGLSFLVGFLFFMGVFYWTNVVSGFEVGDFFLVTACSGLYFGLFGLLLNFVSKHSTPSPVIIAAAIWVTIEFIRSNADFLSWPCALLGHSQYLNLPIIQISSMAGVYGISFLIVMANVAIAEFFSSYLFTVRQPSSRVKVMGNRRTSYLQSIVVAIIVLGFSLAYGFNVLSKDFEGDKVKITIIQGNIPPGAKWTREFSKQIVNKHIKLTEEASGGHNASLIIWPEGAIRERLGDNILLLRRILNLAKKTNTHLLIGSSRAPKFGPREFRRKARFNSAFLISPQKRIEGQYNKMRLMPFSEYLPHKDLLPWPSRIASAAGNFVPGSEWTVFNPGPAKFGVLICWENFFPALFRKYAKKDVDLMVNITNEARFGETAAPYQFLAINVFRAAENRVPIVRAANTGISCFIDPHGRITGRVSENSKDVFVEGYLTQEIRVSQKKTFYTDYGDVFAFACLILTIMVVAISGFKSQRDSIVEMALTSKGSH